MHPTKRWVHYDVVDVRNLFGCDGQEVGGQQRAERLEKELEVRVVLARDYIGTIALEPAHDIARTGGRFEYSLAGNIFVHHHAIDDSGGGRVEVGV